MQTRWISAILCLLSIGAVLCAAPGPAAQTPAEARPCACGAHPPGPPRDRTVEPYAGEPKDLSPYAKFAAPYDLNYTHPDIYLGAGRDLPDPKNLTEVRIGFFGPIEHTPDSVFGLRMLHGAQLAIDEANARGGYGGTPFRLMLHNDYDNWQAKAVYGDDRPTDPAIWGSASNEAVKMIYDDQDWAIFGSINSESTHIILRVALKAEIPIVNSASTDPTIPETYIPWYFTDLQDDRVQSLTLARRIFTELGLKRVALLRVNNRYGRFGVLKLRDAARRLGHPIVIEQKYLPGDTDFTRSLKIIQDSRADAIVLWGDQPDAAGILKQMRALGMRQRVFGAYRTLGPELLAQAGPAAEGFEVVFPYDPTRSDPRWLAFEQRYAARFHEAPEPFAALAYDAMNALLDSICQAGLNRARIHDALADLETYDGVTGPMVFDPNQKNVAPMFLGTVHNGVITYRPATMEKDAPQPPVAPSLAAASSLPSVGETTPAGAPSMPAASSQAWVGKQPSQPAVKGHDFSRANPADLTKGASAPDRTTPQAPYARVGEDPITYAGPARPDLPPGPIAVVLFGPHAADVVHSLAQTASPWQLLPIDSNQNWGAASTALVRALWDRHALAILALDRDAAHLSEQLALKAFVPVVALSDDKALTATNVPWIFRLPAATAPAAALGLVQTAENQSGPNPQRLRDVLASGHAVAGLAFTPAGEPLVP